MSFDVVSETMDKTKFEHLEPGDTVNLERAMRADGRFDGHVVQGHVEGVAQVIDNSDYLTLEIPAHLQKYVIPKGSITIDGVSLTIASVDDGVCEIALVPFTKEATTLGTLKKGDTVNLETDIFVRTILHGKA